MEINIDNHRVRINIESFNPDANTNTFLFEEEPFNLDFM